MTQSMTTPRHRHTEASLYGACHRPRDEYSEIRHGAHIGRPRALIDHTKHIASDVIPRRRHARRAHLHRQHVRVERDVVVVRAPPRVELARRARRDRGVEEEGCAIASDLGVHRAARVWRDGDVAIHHPKGTSKRGRGVGVICVRACVYGRCDGVRDAGARVVMDR